MMTTAATSTTDERGGAPQSGATWLSLSQSLSPDAFCDLVQYNSDGLVPAIVQSVVDGQVLMLAWMNDESLRRSLALGEAVFWSRSRREYWHKGATSGNTQRIVDLAVDCDGDTLLLIVDPAGPACHTGAETCFYRSAAR